MGSTSSSTSRQEITPIDGFAYRLRVSLPSSLTLLSTPIQSHVLRIPFSFISFRPFLLLVAPSFRFLFPFVCPPATPTVWVGEGVRPSVSSLFFRSGSGTLAVFALLVEKETRDD